LINRRAVTKGQLSQKTGEVKLTAELVFGAVQMYFSHRFDGAVKTPEFHWDMWKLFTDHSKPFSAVIAPRGHAKSTAGIHCYGLCELLFRSRDYAYIVSNTEKQASEALGEMKAECQNNDELVRDFRIKDFEKDGETEWVCVLEDVGGKVYKFKVMAFGSEQQVRGLKWNGKRPNLFLIDDFENAEQMSSLERRNKISRTLNNDMIPAGSDYALYRLAATILHDDSVANRIYKDSQLPEGKRQWEVLFRRAHKSFDDFSEILWPEKFYQTRLFNIRQKFINDNNPEGYSMEYLNDPVPPEISYFRPEWFKTMSSDQKAKVLQKRVVFYAAVDFAVSTKERRDYTAICVVAVDQDGYICLVDLIKGRFDSKQIVDEMLRVQELYQPELFAAEGGVIEKTIGPYLSQAMLEKGIYPNLEVFTPVKDKTSRARSIQGKMRAGHVFFDKEASWYPGFEDEMKRFPVAAHDDQVDAFAYIGLLLDKTRAAPSIEEFESEDFFFERGGRPQPTGMCEVTGY
jgi:predicted phage terminase large subunit-like protein